MINIGEVIETNDMVEKENLDVRTITLGISLLDCIDSDLAKVNENIYNKITTLAKNLVATGKEIENNYCIPIVNKRISVTPIALVGGAACKSSEDFVTIAKTLDKAAKEGNPHAMEFPRAKVGGSQYDFSFSGVKSAVLNYLNGAKMKGEEVKRADIAASFQKAVVDVLVEHTMQAAADFGMKKVAIAGGVASNGALRTAMEKACTERGYKFYRPSPIFCTDNAAMIGVAAYYEYIRGTRHSWDLNAVPNLKLGER